MIFDWLFGSNSYNTRESQKSGKCQDCCVNYGRFVGLADFTNSPRYRCDECYTIRAAKKKIELQKKKEKHKEKLEWALKVLNGN